MGGFVVDDSDSDANFVLIEDGDAVGSVVPQEEQEAVGYDMAEDKASRRKVWAYAIASGVIGAVGLAAGIDLMYWGPDPGWYDVYHNPLNGKTYDFKSYCEEAWLGCSYPVGNGFSLDAAYYNASDGNDYCNVTVSPEAAGWNSNVSYDFTISAPKWVKKSYDCGFYYEYKSWYYNLEPVLMLSDSQVDVIQPVCEEANWINHRNNMIKASGVAGGSAIFSTLFAYAAYKARARIVFWGSRCC